MFLLIGADSLADFPTWRQPQRILELATLVAVNRGDFDEAQLRSDVARLGSQAADRLQIVEMPGIDISATDIRRRVREEEASDSSHRAPSSIISSSADCIGMHDFPTLSHRLRNIDPRRAETAPVVIHRLPQMRRVQCVREVGTLVVFPS
ncbi:MAG: hypothetical protein R3B91_01420 [Planctomycetaceae bacterium]